MNTIKMLVVSGLVAGLLLPAVISRAAPPATNVELIPRKTFFGNPDRASVQISPDGSAIAYLAPRENVLNVWVRTIADGSEKAVTHSTTRPIRSYFWAKNGEQIIYLQDRNGDENFRLFAVDVETEEELDLTPFDQIQARVVSSDPDFPDEILVALNNRDSRFHDVWRINTRSGEQTMVYQNDKGFLSLIADRQFRLRLATRFTSSGGMKAYLRDDEEDEWDELVHWGPDDTQTSGPIGFSEDGRTLYLMDSRDANTGRLFAYTIDDDGQASYNLIASDERADLSGVEIDPETGRPQAVAFEFARKEWLILDDSIRGDWNFLTQVADGEMTITSRSRDDSMWTVAYLRDDGPLSYYLYERDSMRVEFLFTNRSQLEGLPLAKMKPFVVNSRDGRELVGYLTTPVGINPRRLPMVLFVHGGPWARDHWGYNSIHQWLANRGYAVLSVNFRGSTGFGKDFVNAGDREWAGRMHDDLIDAVNWAVEEGIADRDRIAIMGGSYGGYATLVGLTFTPDVFACGVDIVGPSNIRTLLKSIPPYWEPIRAMFDRRVGSLDEPDYLDSISPLTRVDAITKPLLIGQGRNDPRVKEAESQQIVDAMRKKGLGVTYVLFPDEGHGFARPKNNLAFFAIAEVFLAEHIGGRYEPIGSSVRESSAMVEAGAGLIRGLSESIE